MKPNAQVIAEEIAKIKAKFAETTPAETDARTERLKRDLTTSMKEATELLASDKIDEIKARLLPPENFPPEHFLAVHAEKNIAYLKNRAAEEMWERMKVLKVDHDNHGEEEESASEWAWDEDGCYSCNGIDVFDGQDGWAFKKLEMTSGSDETNEHEDEKIR